MVEEYFSRNEVGPERAGGLAGSKNVGISSKNPDKNSGHRKPKVSWAMRIIPGLVDPKVRPKGVADGRAG